MQDTILLEGLFVCFRVAINTPTEASPDFVLLYIICELVWLMGVIGLLSRNNPQKLE